MFREDLAKLEQINDVLEIFSITEILEHNNIEPSEALIVLCNYFDLDLDMIVR